MKKALFAILIALIVYPVFAAEPPAVDQKEVAIVHFSKLKDKELDGTAKNITFKPIIGRSNQISYFLLRNDLTTSREIIVKILELTEPEYDIYFDGMLIGTKKKEDLEAGFPVSFSGTMIPPEYRDYYSRVKAGGTEGIKSFSETIPDASTCRAVLESITSWINSIEIGDGLIRSVVIIPSPTGRPLSLAGGRLLFQKPPDFQKSVLHLASAIHTIRIDLIKSVKNITLRNQALTYITPIDIKVTSFGKQAPGEKLTIQGTLTNWTDRVVTGKASLIVPNGWKVKEINSDIKMSGYSKTADIEFEVALPEAVKVESTITVIMNLDVDTVPLKLEVKPDKK